MDKIDSKHHREKINIPKDWPTREWAHRALIISGDIMHQVRKYKTLNRMSLKAPIHTFVLTATKGNLSEYRLVLMQARRDLHWVCHVKKFVVVQ